MGAAIFIRSSVTFTPLPNFIATHIQSYAISLIFNHIPVTIAATYWPPKHKISTNQFNEYLSTLNNNFIIGGDLNAKHIQWGSRITNPRENSLLQFISHSNISILSPPNYTYWPTSRYKNRNILDIFITKIPNNLHT